MPEGPLLTYLRYLLYARGSRMSSSLTRRFLALPVAFVFAVLTTHACGGKIDSSSMVDASTDAGAWSPSVDPSPDRTDRGSAASLPPTMLAADIDLGAVAAGETATLDVPPGALGFNVVVRGDAEGELGVETITSPSGEVVHRGYMPVGAAFETSLSQGIAAASVPQNRLSSTFPVEPGPWKIQLSGSPGSTLRAAARIQISSEGAFHGGAVDVHVYIPEGLRISDPEVAHVVSASGASRDRSVEQRLKAFFAGLRTHFGLVRGDVVFHAADASLRTIRTEAALGRAFAASEGQFETQALHVLLTNELDFGQGVWGIAPGIPGAATRTGTVLSGMALAVTDDTPGELDGLALLHEVGHFVGLTHTTELDGAAADPLADTPSCAGILDPNNPKTLDRCPDKNNLMFPTLVGSSISVSETQRSVFRGSPAYRAFVGGPRGVATDLLTMAGPARPVRVTRSGRELTALERFVLGGLCGASRLDASRLARHLGDARSALELAQIAADGDLPGIVRQRARRMLAALRSPSR